MKCEFNNSCYETAQDGTYCECDWNIENNLEAKIELEIDYDGETQVWNVCEGCAEDLRESCKGGDFETDEVKYFVSEKRFAEKTKSFSKNRSTKTRTIRQNWTQEEADKWQEDWRAKCKKEGSFVYSWEVCPNYTTPHP